MLFRSIGSVAAGDMRTVVWSKLAVAADAGAQVTVPLGSSAKHTLTVAAYRGVSTVTATGVADTTTRTARLTPGVTAPEGAWVLSYWADKSSTTTAWTRLAATSTAAPQRRQRAWPTVSASQPVGSSNRQKAA